MLWPCCKGIFEGNAYDMRQADAVRLRTELKRVVQIRLKVDLYPPPRANRVGGSFGVITFVLWLPTHADLLLCLSEDPPYGMVATEHEPRLLFRGRLRLILADCASGLFVSEPRQVQIFSF